VNAGACSKAARTGMHTSTTLGGTDGGTRDDRALTKAGALPWFHTRVGNEAGGCWELLGMTGRRTLAPYAQGRVRVIARRTAL
jgi:hypothetical protein